MGKPKDKVNVDDLLKKLNAKKTRELMNPVKPFKRQLHIEIQGLDEETKKKLAIKKKKEIAKLIVDFNSANREVLKVKAVEGQIKALYEWLRIKEMCSKYGWSGRGASNILNDYFPECKINGEPIDYTKIHERMFWLKKEHINVAILGINFKNKIEEIEGVTQITKFAGDITYLKIFDKKYVKDVAIKIPVKFKQLPIMRICNVVGTRDALMKYDGRLLDNKWYVSMEEKIKGYFPLKVIERYRCRTDRFYVGDLTNAVRSYYRQSTVNNDRTVRGESVFETLTRGRVSSDIELRRRIYNQVDEDMDAELQEIEGLMGAEGRTFEEISEEIDRIINREVERRLEQRRNRQREEQLSGTEDRLPVGTRVVIEHGNNHARTDLNEGRQECVIIEVRHSGNFDYRARFPNGSRWYIKAEEIVEIHGVEEVEPERR